MALAIAYIKLITGEDIICMLNEEQFDETSQKIQLIHPYTVEMVMHEDGEFDCRSKRWAMFLDQSLYNNSFWVPKTMILLSGQADEIISEAYREWVEEDKDKDKDASNIPEINAASSGNIH
jgi:hypothetical protein